MKIRIEGQREEIEGTGEAQLRKILGVLEPLMPAAAEIRKAMDGVDHAEEDEGGLVHPAPAVEAFIQQGRMAYNKQLPRMLADIRAVIDKHAASS